MSNQTPIESGVKHGCCGVGRACTPDTCMVLPAGKTCGMCRCFSYCRALLGRRWGDIHCDFFPRRFRKKDGV
jgi:hypothetical protein